MAKLVIKKGAEKTVKKAPMPLKSSKTECFEGTIGGVKFLFDAGNGDKLGKIKDGKPVADQAEAIGRKLIARSAAAHGAVRVLMNAWLAAKKTNGKKG